MKRFADTLKDRIQSELSLMARYGVVVLFLLVVSYFLLSLNDETARLSDVASSQAETLALLSDSEAETVWAERLAEAESVAASWEDRLWRAASPGVGAAEIEIALREILQSNSSEVLQIEVSPNPTSIGSINYISYSFSARVAAANLHQFLVQMSTSDRILAITDMQAAAQRSSDYSVKIEGFAPFDLVQTSTE